MAFKHKYTRYATIASGMSRDARTTFVDVWLIKHFYALLMETSERMTYSRLLRRHEERLWDETTKHRFQQANQNEGESLED